MYVGSGKQFNRLDANASCFGEFFNEEKKPLKEENLGPLTYILEIDGNLLLSPKMILKHKQTMVNQTKEI